MTTYSVTREKNTNKAVYTLLTQQAGRPYMKTYLDHLGRTVKTESPGPSGIVFTYTEYNARGQISRVILPYFESEIPRKGKWYEYDFARRLKRERLSNFIPSQQLITTYEYDGFTTSVTTPAGQTTSKTYNAIGDLLSVIDPMGGKVEYRYAMPGGYVDTIIAPGNARTVITYDSRGRQTSIHDPNAGIIRYTYNAFDQVLTQRDAQGKLTTNVYDTLGRLFKVHDADGYTTTYSYVPQGDPNVGRLQSVSRNNDYENTSHTYSYDSLGRVTHFYDFSPVGGNFTTQYIYDTNGDLTSYIYPSGYQLNYEYDTNGFQIAIYEDSTNALVWKLDSVNAFCKSLAAR